MQDSVHDPRSPMRLNNAGGKILIGDHYVEERFLSEQGIQTNFNAFGPDNSVPNSALTLKTGNINAVIAASTEKLPTSAAADSYTNEAGFCVGPGRRTQQRLKNIVMQARAEVDALEREQIEADRVEAEDWRSSTTVSFGNPGVVEGASALVQTMSEEQPKDIPTTIWTDKSEKEGFARTSLFTTRIEVCKVDQDQLIATGRL
eukprot:m.265320 g.265320  ORF g.265320 m.265320 type:complete len:203 (-) comp61170_c0_seq1:469-1077(-)